MAGLSLASRSSLTLQTPKRRRTRAMTRTEVAACSSVATLKSATPRLSSTAMFRPPRTLHKRRELAAAPTVGVDGRILRKHPSLSDSRREARWHLFVATGRAQLTVQPPACGINEASTSLTFESDRALRAQPREQQPAARAQHPSTAMDPATKSELIALALQPRKCRSCPMVLTPRPRELPLFALRPRRAFQ